MHAAFVVCRRRCCSVGSFPRVWLRLVRRWFAAAVVPVAEVAIDDNDDRNEKTRTITIVGMNPLKGVDL